jgi:hypothetical protein
MQMNKTKISAVTLILMLSVSALIVLLPSATAATTSTSFPFIGAFPNPVGVNQTLWIHTGITLELAAANQYWDNLTVTIKKPNNETDTLGPMRTISTGGMFKTYTPTMVGTYYLQTHFPEQALPAAVGGKPRGTIMLAADSEIIAVNVTLETVQLWPGVSLPTEYWTRPINAQFREWATIAGSSWMDNEYNDAPDSPHVLWTKPLTEGGLVGGDVGDVSMEHGDAYQGKWSSRMIIAGTLIYTHDTNIRPLVYTAIDLRSGKELWKKTFLNNQSIAFGQLFFWDSYNYHGTFAYLWVSVSSGFGATAKTNWTAFEVFSGEQRYSIVNVPSGTSIFGDNGNIFIYNVNLATARMTLWNQSALGSMEGSWTPSGGFGGNMYGTLDAAANSAAARRAYALNISIPAGLPGSVRGVKLGDRVVGSSTSATAVTVWGFSLEPGLEGRLLFNTTWKTPDSWVAANISFTMYESSWITTDLDARIGLIWFKEERTLYAFSLETGKYLWKTEPQIYLDIYSEGVRIAYDKVYSVGMGGVVYCYNTTNGKRIWTYEAKDVYHENLWGNNWPLELMFANDKKLYFFHSEHSPINPLYRGAPAICLDAETGDEVWRVDGLYRKTDWGGGPILGDSVIAMYNTYDQLVFAIGKGPSAMTVEAPNVAVQTSTPFVIRGTVTDVSPGTQDDTMKLRFPYGVPAISDASVGEWMKYVYAQFPLPTNVTGVNVSIDAVDPNNNFVHLGDATTDYKGSFGCTINTTIAGNYKIIASFGGSNSYYPSFAESFMTVTEQPAPAATPTPLNVNDVIQPLVTYLVVATIAIIIAIAIVGILLLRKRA